MRIGYLMQAGAPDVRQGPISGPAAHVWHVFEELAALGHELRLLAMYGDTVWRSDDLQQFEPVIVATTDAGVRRWFERGVRRTQSAFRLPYVNYFDSERFAAAVLQELAGCDLYYERMGWMGCGGAIAAQRSGTPLVLEVNGDHLAEYEMLGVAPRGIQRAASLRYMAWAVSQAALVVATGEGWRTRFIERWSAPPERVKVVENGSEVVELLARETLRAWQPPKAGEAVRLVYVGAFEPWHGITVLLRALAQARPVSAPLHLDLIGDGSEMAEIRRLIEELDLADLLTLHGFLRSAEFAPLLGRSDIGLSPYCGRVEYSGLKLLDYKAAGLVTIASGAEGQPAVLRHGETGWIVPPCDVDALAAAIVELSTKPDVRRCIGQAARLDAEVLHSWRHTAQELDSLFRELVQA